MDDGSFALPLTPHGAVKLAKLFQSESKQSTTGESMEAISVAFRNATECTLAHIVDLPRSKKSLIRSKSDYEMLHNVLHSKLLEMEELTGQEKSNLLEEIPRSWERHGNLVVLPKNSFVSLQRQTLAWEQVWKVVSEVLRCVRVAVDGRVACDGFRTSTAELVLGKDGWVEHVDNGVKYIFDVTKCIFSSGNISEKIRVANLDCSGETVVDLYAGIGYFTLPYLIHAGAEVVHACEWNPHAVEALRRGLVANGVEKKCRVYFGDNRKVRYSS